MGLSACELVKTAPPPSHTPILFIITPLFLLLLLLLHPPPCIPMSITFFTTTHRVPLRPQDGEEEDGGEDGEEGGDFKRAQRLPKESPVQKGVQDDGHFGKRGLGG